MRIDQPKYAFRQFLIPKEQFAAPRPLTPAPLLPPAALEALGDACECAPARGWMDWLAAFYGKAGIVIRPQNPLLLVWDLLIILIVIFYILEIGFLIGFGDQFWHAEMNNILGLHVLFILMLVLDILISPIKAHYKEGLLVTEVGVILRRYLEAEVYIDVLALAAVLIPLGAGRVDANWVKVVWLVKFYTVSRINDEFERVTQLYITLNTTYLCIKLAVILIIYAHYMGIAFYLVSWWIYRNNYYGPNTPNLCWIYNSWAFYNMTLILSWSQMYTYIMYFSIAVVTTIAYGDITPKNPIECIFMVFIFITISIILGYLMTEILRLLINVFSYNFERKYRHFELVSKLRTENVRTTTTALVRAHTEEIDREEQYRNRQVEDNVLHFLPAAPLYGLLLVIYRRFLAEIGISFANEAIPESVRPTGSRSLFLETFMQEIKEERQYTGDVVYQLGEKWDAKEGGHRAYFFTKKEYAEAVTLGVGELPQIRIGSTEPSFRHSFPLTTAQSVYGQVEFLSGQARGHWAFCVRNCVVFSVGREQLLKHYHLLSQREKESLAVRMELAEEIDCFICGKEHYFLRCPFTFLNVGSLIRQDRKVLRKRMLFKKDRTRLKTESAWTIFKRVRGLRLPLTKEYKERLMANRNNHSLFVEYELGEEESSSEEEFEDRLHEVEVIVGRVYADYADGRGEELETDRVCNFETYRLCNNIAEIEKDFNHRDRRVANFKNLIHANILRLFE